MESQTISQISKQFNISTRTLRYYEQIGLIQPVKKEDFAYRTYDMGTIFRLQQIIVLRKLRIPLRQIADILKSDDTAVAINAFSQNLAEIDGEITALSTIKNIIQTLLKRLHVKNEVLRLLDDESLLEIVDSLTISKINFKEEKTVEELNKATEKLNKFDIRFVFLKPTRVLSAFIKGTGRTVCENDDAVSTGGDRCESYWTGLSSTSTTAGEVNKINGDITILDDFRKIVGNETEPHQWECYIPIRAKKL